MLPNDIKVEKEETKKYKPLPEDVYQVELLDINQKEEETYDSKKDSSTPQEMETQFDCQFTLLEGKEGENSLRGRNIWVNFIPSYLYINKKGTKNKLYQITEALLGRELTREEEFGGIDGKFLNDLVGKQCRVGVKHKPSGDKIYENIETYYVMKDELTPLTPEEKEKATIKKDKEEVKEVKSEEISEDTTDYAQEAEETDR